MIRNKEYFKFIKDKDIFIYNAINILDKLIYDIDIYNKNDILDKKDFSRDKKEIISLLSTTKIEEIKTDFCFNETPYISIKLNKTNE